MLLLNQIDPIALQVGPLAVHWYGIMYLLGFAAALRELVHQFAGIISWIWMLVDHDDRTLADIAGHTHVVHVDKS